MQPRFLPPDLRSKVPLRAGRIELTPASEKLIVERTLKELAPLVEAKKLGAFLLQMSATFRPRNHQLTELDSIRDALAQHLLAVELRNRDWVSELPSPHPMGRGAGGDVQQTQLHATIDYFRSRSITMVLVDAPESEHFTVMPGLNVVTNPELAYFRFHGRNAEGYIRGRSVADRFDHDYTDTEVVELTGRIEELKGKVARLHVAANNNRSNYAPKLAAKLRAQFEAERELLREKQRKTRTGELF
jgi:uncharacterized protein YecE (DUF72 family)